MLSIYPAVQHLMCYFHVVKNCKDHLKRCKKDIQSSVLSDINYLHNSVSKEEFKVRYDEVVQKWNEIDSDVVKEFIDYFNSQWNADNTFKNWKIYCSEPGKFFVMKHVWKSIFSFIICFETYCIT